MSAARASRRRIPAAPPETAAEAVEHFEYGGRLWVARRLLNEARTAIVLRVVPAAKGPPWPSRAEHRAAVAAFRGGDG